MKLGTSRWGNDAVRANALQASRARPGRCVLVLLAPRLFRLPQACVCCAPVRQAAVEEAMQRAASERAALAQSAAAERTALERSTAQRLEEV
jgi:hypothetical protein